MPEAQAATPGEVAASTPAAGGGEAPAEPAAVQAVKPAEPVRAVPDIAADVSRKLQAVGRPAEEADAAGKVTEALWRTRAAAFEGRKGTAEEMYAREAPEIRAGRQGTKVDAGKALDLAQEGPGPAISLRGDELGDMTAPGSWKVALAEYKRQASDGPVRNPDLGEVQFSKRGAEKSVSGSPDKLRLIAKLREIIANGKLVHSAEDLKGRGTVKAFHTLETPVRLGNADVVARTIIREDTNGKFHYDLQRADAASVAEATPDDAASGAGARGAAPSPGALGGPPLPKTYEQRIPSEGEINLEAGKAEPGSELAQGLQGKIRLTQDGRSVITLMRTADASTFLHETGHDWLERMMRDAADPDAPAAHARRRGGGAKLSRREGR